MGKKSRRTKLILASATRSALPRSRSLRNTTFIALSTTAQPTRPYVIFDLRITHTPARGWQGSGVTELRIENGAAPASQAEKQIGLSYVTTKYMDVTGDGQDEALVVLKIETAGSAIPQIVYVFTWKDDGPELIWYFRTGDRADAA